MTADEPRLMLTDMSTCPVCCGMGVHWIPSYAGCVAVPCSACFGSGRLYTSTTSEVQS
jgi:DnaJ-class molecular chaperone